MGIDPISIGLEFVSKIADKIWPDPAAKAAGLLELERLRQAGELAHLAADTDIAKGQLAINEAEAANNDKFSSRWRPLIGYICGAAFAYKFVIQPFLIFAIVACGSKFDYHTLPYLDWSEMSPVLLGLLGLGGLRTVEKIKNVS